MGSVDEQARTEPESEVVSPPPLVAFAHRHRLIIGVVVAAVMVGVFVWALLALPEATAPGLFGVIQRYSFPVMCLLIATVGLTWGLKVKQVWTNVAAYAAIGTYLVYLVIGWVYENFLT